MNVFQSLAYGEDIYTYTSPTESKESFSTKALKGEPNIVSFEMVIMVGDARDSI